MVYFVVMDVHNGFQLNRYFQMYTYHKAGTDPRTFFQEIVQQWMQPGGKHEVIALNRGGMGYYMSDNFHGDMEIRDRNLICSKYNVYPDKIYPKMKCLPIYKRNGFKGQVGISAPYNLFTSILDDSKAETLLKAKQYALLEARMHNRRGAVNQYWNSVKICIRNSYIVKDPVTWLDYLELLHYFNRDLNSPKYVCPIDLKRVHDKLVAKKRDVEKRLDIERKKKRIEADQQAYVESKQAYFGLAFSDWDLTIKVLESVQEFIDEGDAHKHCVYTNGYYKKPDSLIFSAKIKGKPVETIEISISKGKVIQSRGLGNQASKHNQQIIELLTKNMHVIQKRYRELKKAVKIMQTRSMKISA